MINKKLSSSQEKEEVIIVMMRMNLKMTKTEMMDLKVVLKLKTQF